MNPLRNKVIAALFLLCLAPGAAHPALPAPRPFSGCGILVLKQGAGVAPESLALYQEPGLMRLADRGAASLPRLAGDADQPLLVASERRGSWIRLYLDDAGRQGWLEERRGWEYASWREFLPGRSVRVLPGLKKEWYALRGAPLVEGAELSLLRRDQQVTVVEVAGDWARLQAPAGWFRWRDADGRLTVALGPR